MLDKLSAKVVVLGVEQTHESSVDGAFLRFVDDTVRQQAKDDGTECAQISFQDGCQAFQVGLEGAGALLAHTEDETFQPVLDLLRFRDVFTFPAAI